MLASVMDGDELDFGVVGQFLVYLAGSHLGIFVHVPLLQTTGL